MNKYLRLLLNAVLLALMSAISTLVVDYVATRCVPSINVMYGAMIFGISVFVTTLYTSLEKNGNTPPANPAPPLVDPPKGAEVASIDPPLPPTKDNKKEGWVLGMVM